MITMLESSVLEGQLSESAAEFSKALVKLGMLVDADMSQAIRKGVLDVFGNIIRRSPVVTGAYRASHGIANGDPGDEAGIVVGKKGKTIGEEVALSKAQAWMWKVGDGDIFIYNNVPYAERIENGWSTTKAPAGVYRVALAEVTQFLSKSFAESKLFESSGGGVEI